MRINVTSGLPLSFYASACVLLLLLLSVGERVHAKRGCSAFGHSCFGGHGKRFDPQMRDDVMLDNELLQSQEYEPPRLSNEPLIIEQERKFQLEEKPLFDSRRQASQRLEPYTLSFLVGKWLASHRRLHHSDLEANNK